MATTSVKGFSEFVMQIAQDNELASSVAVYGAHIKEMVGILDGEAFVAIAALGKLVADQTVIIMELNSKVAALEKLYLNQSRG